LAGLRDSTDVGERSSTRAPRSHESTVGSAIYAVSGINNAGGAGTLSGVPVNEIYEP
jgi:hypothetical protein